MVVDVDVPNSRKRGFAKKQLSELLEQSDIRYEHIRGLGSPRELRQVLRDDGDLLQFVEQYSEYIKGHRDEVHDALSLIKEHNCCLLCYERDASMCHSSLIVLEMQRISPNGSIEVIHI